MRGHFYHVFYTVSTFFRVCGFMWRGCVLIEECSLCIIRFHRSWRRRRRHRLWEFELYCRTYSIRGFRTGSYGLLVVLLVWLLALDKGMICTRLVGH